MLEEKLQPENINHTKKTHEIYNLILGKKSTPQEQNNGSEQALLFDISQNQLYQFPNKKT